MSLAGAVFDARTDTHVPTDRPDGKMSAMGDFFSDSNNGPVILLLILVVDLAVVLGGLYLVFRTRARRVVRRSAAIFRRVMDDDPEEARTLVAEWDRGGRPKDPFARLHIAKAWSMIGEHQRALSVLDSTKVPKGRMGRSLRRKASELRYRSLKGIGENDRADWFLRDAAADDPGAPWLGEFSSEVSKADTRQPWESKHERRERWSPRDARAIAVLAQEAVRERRFEDAAELHERFLKRVAKDPTARLILPEMYLAHGAALLAASRDEEAEVAFQEYRARSSDPSAAGRQVIKIRAETLLYVGRIAEALSAYKTLVASREGPGALAGVAMCRLRLGDPQGASDAMDRAEVLGLDPDKARPVRAQIMADQGLGAEADELALRAAGGDHATTDPAALYTLAYVRATGNLPGAEETLRRYVELQPNDPDLIPLLERPAPGGRPWRELIEIPARPDAGTKT